VSLDSRSTPAPASDAVPVIENELPSYRAISGGAVASLLLGLASILSFADRWFVVAGVAAIVVGILAVRKITRYSDVLTGQGIAQAGIALGLIFSLSSVTVAAVQGWTVKKSAERFARNYAKVLQTGTMADIVWHRFEPSMRKGKQPQEMLDEMVKNATDPTMMEAYLGGLRNIQNRISRPEQRIRFVEIEAAGYDRLTPFAFALFQIDGPDEQGKPKTEYVMIELKCNPDQPGLNWYITEVVYPYTRKSHELKVEPVDDGHGHGH
jgi:hypothetical protein